jgi:hypothetical protein
MEERTICDFGIFAATTVLTTTTSRLQNSGKPSVAVLAILRRGRLVMYSEYSAASVSNWLGSLRNYGVVDYSGILGVISTLPVLLAACVDDSYG